MKKNLGMKKVIINGIKGREGKAGEKNGLREKKRLASGCESGATKEKGSRTLFDAFSLRCCYVHAHIPMVHFRRWLVRRKKMMK